MKNFILTLGFLSFLPFISLAGELSSDLNLDQSNQPEQIEELTSNIEELTSNTNGSYLKADTNQLGQRYLVLFEKDSASCLIPSKVKLVWMPDHIQEKLEKALGDFIINDEALSKELNLPLCNQDQAVIAFNAFEKINYDNLEASFATGLMPMMLGNFIYGGAIAGTLIWGASLLWVLYVEAEKEDQEKEEFQNKIDKIIEHLENIEEHKNYLP